MTQLALLTNDFLGPLSSGPNATHRFIAEDDLPLVAALEREGYPVTPIFWRAEADAFAEFDICLVRSPLDYILDREAFLNTLRALQKADVALLNPYETLAWNSDKTYLAELSAQGIACVDTFFTATDPSQSLTAIMEAHAWPEVVVKRTISAGAHFTHRVAFAEAAAFEAQFAEEKRNFSLMVQPFIRQIVSQGEWSLVFLDGGYSHAVLKKPADGDYRVQQQHGGSLTPATPPPELIAQAAKALAAVPSPWLYARVDGCVLDAEFTLMELELIEPELFFRSQKGAAERLAKAIAKYASQA
jgi:glutathione synthase/RimK-type ligase-like ATP-grasp enzyme